MNETESLPRRAGERRRGALLLVAASLALGSCLISTRPAFDSSRGGAAPIQPGVFRACRYDWNTGKVTECKEETLQLRGGFYQFGLLETYWALKLVHPRASPGEQDHYVAQAATTMRGPPEWTFTTVRVSHNDFFQVESAACDQLSAAQIAALRKDGVLLSPTEECVIANDVSTIARYFDSELARRYRAYNITTYKRIR